MAGQRTLLSALPSIRTMVFVCLLAQVGAAAMLVSDDAVVAVTLQGRDSIKSTPTVPISPGDQSRPFVRVSVPRHVDTRLRTQSPVALPEELPLRLAFKVSDTEDHGRVLLAVGRIETGDALRFEAELESLTAQPDAVAFHSPGGSVDDAQAIGRLIRDKGLRTLIMADAACMSSCPYALAGGTERTVSRSGWVGLHQHYFRDESILPSFLAVQSIQDGQGDTMEFLSDMGIDPLILIHVLKTPPDQIYLLVEDELLDYNLATSVVD